MSMVDLRIKCEGCGEMFRHRKACQNRDAAADYEDWARENITLCPACYREGMERIQMEKDAAAIAEKGLILPEIDGTEKQIAWANKIRLHAIAIVCAAMKPEAVGKLQTWVNHPAMLDARFWIDERDNMTHPRGVVAAMGPVCEPAAKGAH